MRNFFLSILFFVVIQASAQSVKLSHAKIQRRFLVQRVENVRTILNPIIFLRNPNFTLSTEPAFTFTNFSQSSNSTYFSARVEANITESRLQLVLVPKAYYSYTVNNKLSYSFFVLPKYNTTTHKSIVKYGIRQNYALTKNVLLGGSLGCKIIDDGTTKAFGYIKIIYIIP